MLPRFALCLCQSRTKRNRHRYSTVLRMRAESYRCLLEMGEEHSYHRKAQQGDGRTQIEAGLLSNFRSGGVRRPLQRRNEDLPVDKTKCASRFQPYVISPPTRKGHQIMFYGKLADESGRTYLEVSFPQAKPT